MKITKKLILQLYSNTEKSGLQVAKELGISRTQFGRYLIKYKIPGKKLSEVMSGRKIIRSDEHKSKLLKHIVGKRKEENRNWKGGRRIQDGYVMIYEPTHPGAMSNGYIAEHRLVAGKKLGRELEKYEHVHHLNGKKDDNRPENLEVVNGWTHNLITRLETRIKELEKEIENIKKLRAENLS